MSILSLRDRFSSYEEVSSFKLTKKLPLIINLNGRNFKKTTSLLNKPFSNEFMKLMGQTLIKLASEIEGAVFLYSFDDKIDIICRNDQAIQTEAYYDNDLQKIVSATASLASINLYTAAQQSKVEFIGPPVFLSKAFILPSITETINYLVSRQHIASHTAISTACFYELLKKHPANEIFNIIENLSMEEKYDLLFKEANIKPESFPLGFWRGIACYRAPKVIETQYGKEIKNKLFIDDELPSFNKDQTLLNNIFRGK